MCSSAVFSWRRDVTIPIRHWGIGIGIDIDSIGIITSLARQSIHERIIRIQWCF